MSGRQLDILLTGPNFYTLPKHLPGARTAEDYVFFHWPCNFDVRRYCVAVESSDNSGDSVYRLVGPLQKAVELPFVRFGAYTRIGVIPDKDDIPSFESELIRGSTYIIPDTRGKNGRFQMERHGKK